MTKELQVQCRGLPWECTEAELRDFFGNNGIKSVDIPRRNGRASGDATVEFDNDSDYKDALKKDREHLGARYIEVFPMDSAPPRRRDRDDYRPRGGPPSRDRYADRYSDRGSGGGGGASGQDSVVRLRGLPFSVTIRDIADFLAPLPIVRDGILLPDQHRARPGGEAFVCFETMESVQIAKQRHMKNIGHRYIEVFEATYRELVRFADDSGLRVPRLGPQPFVAGPPAAAPSRAAYDPYAQHNDSYRGGSGIAASGYRGAEPEDPYGRSRAGPTDYGRSSYDSYPQQQQQQSSYGSGGGGALQVAQQSSGYYDNYAPKPAYDNYGRAPDPRDPRDARGPLESIDLRDVGRDSRLSDPRAADPRGAAPVDPYTGEPRYSDYGYDSRDSRDSYWRGNSGPQAHNGSALGGGASVPPAPVARDPYASGESWASGGGAGGAPSADRDRYGGGGYGSEPYGQREAGGAMRRQEYGRPDDRYVKTEPYGYGRDRGDYGGRPGAQQLAGQGQQFILRMRGIPFRATEADVHDFFAPIRPNKVELLRDSYQRLSGDARVVFFNRKDYDEALMKDKQYMGERYIEMIPDNGRY